MKTEIVETQKSDRGFTLVELLIVIVILGILATVTVFAVRGITNQGKSSACAADKKTLEVAAESSMAQTGTYPVSAAQMVTDGLLRDVSTNWTYAPPGVAVAAVVAVPGNAGPDTILGTIDDVAPIAAAAAIPAGSTYTLSPVAPCI